MAVVEWTASSSRLSHALIEAALDLVRQLTSKCLEVHSRDSPTGGTEI
ncbi:MAG: hypothetical protein M3P34_07075 [Actinomycetota bacterium]|nr:hypothetical protein [Actinomycetota bacterium]